MRNMMMMVFLPERGILIRASEPLERGKQLCGTQQFLQQALSAKAEGVDLLFVFYSAPANNVR